MRVGRPGLAAGAWAVADQADLGRGEAEILGDGAVAAVAVQRVADGREGCQQERQQHPKPGLAELGQQREQQQGGGDGDERNPPPRG